MQEEISITDIESSIRSDIANADPNEYELFDEGSFYSFNLSSIEIKKTTIEGLCLKYNHQIKDKNSIL